MWKRKCTSRAPKYRKLVTNRQTWPLHISGQLKKSFVEEVASNWHMACSPPPAEKEWYGKTAKPARSVGYGTNLFTGQSCTVWLLCPRDGSP